MIIQLLVIITVFLYSKILSSRSSIGTLTYEKSRKNLCIFATILLVLQSGLRNVAVGADTYSYFIQFENDIKAPWSQIIGRFTDVYVYGEGKDAGYQVFDKLCSNISTNYTIYLLIIACIFFIPLMKVVYRNTLSLEHIVIAVLVYESLFYSFFSITGCRQTIETGLCLLAFEEIKNKNLKKFLLFIFIGAFIHKSCLIFLPFYWIATIKKTYLLFYLSVLSFPFMMVFGRAFTVELALLSGSENYLNYANEEAAGAVTLSLFYIALLFSTFYQYKQNKDYFDDHSYIVNAVTLGLFFLPLTFVSSALMRIVQYYSIFLIVFVGYMKPIKANTRRNIFYPIAVVLLLYKIISTNATYGFFWETMALGSNYM